MAKHNPLTFYEPNQLDNQLDNFDYSETSAVIFQNEAVDMDTEPSYSCDAELDDELIGKALILSTNFKPILIAQDPRCQSGPSAGNSFDPKEGRFSKNYGADQQKTALTNSLHQQQLLVGRKDSKLRYVLFHKFLRKLCYRSKKWRWLNQ